MAQEAGAFSGRRVAGADRDGRFVIGVAETLGGLGDADEWGAEVALDVDGEGFDRGNIDDATTGVVRGAVSGEH